MDVQRVNDLIESIQENRQGLEEMLESVVQLRGSIDTVAPNTNDFKFKHRLEEKMKTVASVLDSELSIRKQLDNSVKDEIAIMGKYLDKDEKDDRKFIESLAKLIESKSGEINGSSITIEDE